MNEQTQKPKKNKAGKIFSIVGIALGSLLLLCVLYNVGRYLLAYNQAYRNPVARELGGTVSVHFRWHSLFVMTFNTSIHFPPEVTREQIDAALQKYYGRIDNVEIPPDGTVAPKINQAADSSK